VAADATLAGSSDGGRHALARLPGDARSSFLRRPELAESDYRDYSTAYDQAYRSALRLMGALS
jgi:hypothetical protein